MTLIDIRDAWPNSWDDLAIGFDRHGRSYLATCARGDWFSVITKKEIFGIKKWIYLKDYLNESEAE